MSFRVGDVVVCVNGYKSKFDSHVEVIEGSVYTVGTVHEGVGTVTLKEVGGCWEFARFQYANNKVKNLRVVIKALRDEGYTVECTVTPPGPAPMTL